MGIRIPCIICTETWVLVIHGKIWYTIQYFLVYLQSCVTITTIQFYSILKPSPTPKIPFPLAVTPHPLLLYTLATTTLPCFCGFAVLVCHRDGVTWYVALCICLLSLSTVSFRTTHAVALHPSSWLKSTWNIPGKHFACPPGSRWLFGLFELILKEWVCKFILGRFLPSN